MSHVWMLARDSFPLTLRGTLLAGACAGVYVYWGEGQGDLVLRTLSLAGAGLWLATGISVVGSGWVARRRARRLHAHGPGFVTGHLEAGRAHASGARLPRRRGWIEFGWDSGSEGIVWSAPGRGRSAREHWTPLRRGVWSRLERRVRVRDGFGLWSWVVRAPELRPADRPLRALPDPGALARADILEILRAGADREHPAGTQRGDRLESRAYGPGDPARHILWKAWGRSRRLRVRSPERAFEVAPVAAAYLVCGPGDEASAAWARVALESGALGPAPRFAADGCAADRGLDAARAALATSALYTGPCQIEAFLAREPMPPWVFVPDRPGPWIEAVARISTPGAVAALFVATDRADDERGLAEIGASLQRALGGAALAIASRSTGHCLRLPAAQRRAA